MRSVDHGQAGVTRLLGPIADPCHLHGVLAHLTSVGVELVSLGPVGALTAAPGPTRLPHDPTPGAQA